MKSAAEKASGGDWVKESGDGWEAVCSNDDQANSGFIIAHFVGPEAAANREFAQAASPANVLALVEALEKAQRANAAQDDHINQQQDRIEQLEKKNAELGKHVGMLEKRLRGTEESLIASTDMVTELESRTVNVKLPKRSVGEVMHMSGFSRDYAEGWCAGNDNAIHEMRVAGVNVIEGEQNNG
ncbi:ead/Ea22-like family protein [Pluralibacter gergoviae]|nr:ead/Ea22-like family protein [Pluralibacter gergoviae]ELC3015633.1 ead/Ea22-like family protein [Pluralibacter gergoviae]ELC3020612.1 ead/Ea22-like family protein [Pluralibacter gergoviae]